MDLILGYVAGLLTLINPCVLPILPIVLASAMQAGRYGPVALAVGMGVSFVALGMLVAVAGRTLGLNEAMIANTGAVLMIGFGLILLIPRFSEGFATATAGMAARADSEIDEMDTSGVGGQIGAGVLLGAVWSPCIGPTLGGAIALASQGENLLRAGSIMVAFALGVATIVIALGYGAQSVIRSRRDKLVALSAYARPIAGGIFVAVGLGILFKVHHTVEIWALETLPPWLLDLSVAL